MKIKLAPLIDFYSTIKIINFVFRNLILSLNFILLGNVFSQSIGLNTTGAAPNSKALLDIDATGMSTKGGILIPRMTTGDRNALSSTGIVPESLLIYNTTTQCFEAWNQSSLVWVAFGCLNCQMPDLFDNTLSTAYSCDYFVANWSVSGGAAGYYLDVSSSSTFASFVPGFNNLSVGNVTSFLVGGLSPNTTYFYRVRAVNSCGTVNSNVLSISTLSCSDYGSTFSVGCDVSQVEANYSTVTTSLSGAVQTWITRNLGATANASAVISRENSEAGCYFQFNRSQAYGFDNGGNVSPAWTITSISESSDWLVTNDPCRLQLGGTWRLPTQSELQNVDSNGAWSSAANAYSSVLKLHNAGCLNTTDGTLVNRGSVGYYCSSTQWDVTKYMGLLIFSNFSNMNSINKAYGLSARCLK
jgi:hypothetical protein